MRKMYGRGALMAEVARNGSPSAGICLLGAVVLVVAVLAFAGFGGRNEARRPLLENMPQDMFAERMIHKAGQGISSVRTR